DSDALVALLGHDSDAQQPGKRFAHVVARGVKPLRKLLLRELLTGLQPAEDDVLLQLQCDAPRQIVGLGGYGLCGQVASHRDTRAGLSIGSALIRIVSCFRGPGARQSAGPWPSSRVETVPGCRAPRNPCASPILSEAPGA